MDALKKWMIIRFTPYKTTPPLKWMFTQKLVFKSSLLLNAECVIQVYCMSPQPAATTFASPSVFILLFLHCKASKKKIFC